MHSVIQTGRPLLSQHSQDNPNTPQMQHAVATTKEGISPNAFNTVFQDLLMPSSAWESIIKVTTVGITITPASSSQVAKLASIVVNSSLGTCGSIFAVI
jgi:hypothetical protein